MKAKNLFIVFCLVLFTLSFVTAQNTKEKKIEFKVTGNCEMCKKTIESSLKGKPGIKSASWNKNTEMMTVSFDPSKTSEEQIHQAVADSGYDTDKIKASDKAYHNLPGCCQYERSLHKKKN